MNAYRDLLRAPHMRALLVAVVAVRLPIATNGLALVLFLREETGSFSVAGAAAGGLALGTAIGAPLVSRLVDRRGARVLLPLALGQATGLAALVLLGWGDAPPPALVATAALTGACLPPGPAMLRSRFPQLLGGDARLVASAYALDSVLLELSFVVAPLLTAVLVATVDPAAALASSAGIVVAATLAFKAALPAGEAVSGRRGGDLLGPLRSAGIRTLVVAMLPVGFAIGALEIALVAFAASEGAPGMAGVLLAVWSIGSAAGGFVYGLRPRRSPVAALHLRLTLMLPLTLLPLLGPGSVPLMMLLLLPAGALIAPIIATRNELAAAAAPAGTATEALTWPVTALLGGLALGAAAAGALTDAAGWKGAVLAAVGAAALGAALSPLQHAALHASGAAERATQP